MVEKDNLPTDEPNIFLTDRCNQDCIFCSSVREDRIQKPDEIESCIRAQKETLSIEGGEPTLSKDLLRWVSLARDTGIRDIILSTNGVALSNRRFVESLLNAGVTLFNVNFPSHIEELSDFLTQAKGSFKRRVKALRNLIDLAGGEKVRLTFVINRLNYHTMPQYAWFVRMEFPGIFYIEFNMVKVCGHVKGREFLVPRLAEIQPYLSSAAGFCGGRGMKFIVDGIPLCFLDGFESASIDVEKLLMGDHTYLEEKARQEQCKRCTLKRICAGPRVDYVELYGAGELKSSMKSPRPIIQEIESRACARKR